MTVSEGDLLLDTLRMHGAPDSAELRRGWQSARLDGLASLVAFEGCTVWLYCRLQDLDILGDIEPTFQRWLAHRARVITTRNLLVDAQTDALVQTLDDMAVPHVLLKGAARRLVADVYPYADARATSDVDVLLPEELARPTWERLRNAGFDLAQEPKRTFEGHHHLPALSNDGWVAVELHTSVAKGVLPAVAWRRIHGGARVVHRGGRATRVPSATELFWHALTHAPLRRPGAFRIRFLQDAAVVWAGATDIDWDDIASRLDSHEIENVSVARQWLGAAQWLSGGIGGEPHLGISSTFDLSRALRWRLSVFRLFAGGIGRGGEVRHRARSARWGRLLIDEGVRVDVGLPWISPVANVGPTLRAGRRAAAIAAQLCYLSWRGSAR